jgi:hypothetical protein
MYMYRERERERSERTQLWQWVCWTGHGETGEEERMIESEWHLNTLHLYMKIP